MFAIQEDGGTLSQPTLKKCKDGLSMGILKGDLLRGTVHNKTKFQTTIRNP